MLKITEVKIFIVPDNSESDNLRAFATIVLNDSFVVRDLKIIEGTNGTFIAMPARKMKDGTFKDVAHPMDKKTREMIEDAVFEEYYSAINSSDVTHQERI